MASTHTAYLACLLVACSIAPSRAPLGGNYALPEAAPAGDRQARAESLATPRAEAPASDSKVTPIAAPSATSAKDDESALTKAPATDTLRFEPLQAGSRIKAEVTLSTSAEMNGALPGMPDNVKLVLDAKLRAEIALLKVSAQSLDELELKLTTLSMHAVFAGQDADNKQEPPETYRITLSGATPTIHGPNGSDVVMEDRIKIALLIVPLAEFYAHWAPSPTLELKSGWSSKASLPIAATLFTSTGDGTLRTGPLSARFTSRANANGDVPFELQLPLEYGNKLGKVALDLSGSAKLNAKSGRPTAFEMSGPLSGIGGPRGSQLSISGKLQIAGTLSYP